MKAEEAEGSDGGVQSKRSSKFEICGDFSRSVPNRKWVGILAIAVVLLSYGTTVYAQDGKTRIRIAIPSPSICCLHFFAAYASR